MKIICIGRNYSEHIRELNNNNPTEPIIFMKSDNSICNLKFFPIPDFSDEIHHEVEVCVKINKVGKHISKKFAHRYYDEITVGIDFTARDLQKKLKEKGYPWEISKNFDNSCVLGEFINKRDLDLENLNFSLQKNNIDIQKGNTKDMIFDIDYIIFYVSRFFTLKKGDIVMTGTPKGVSKVESNDIIECYIENKKLISMKIK